jgi:hypothetical protein
MYIKAVGAVQQYGQRSRHRAARNKRKIQATIVLSYDHIMTVS